MKLKRRLALIREDLVVVTEAVIAATLAVDPVNSSSCSWSDSRASPTVLIASLIAGSFAFKEVFSSSEHVTLGAAVDMKSAYVSILELNGSELTSLVTAINGIRSKRTEMIELLTRIDHLD